MKKTALFASLIASILAMFPIELVATEFSFSLQYVDVNYGGNGRPGWTRAGDLDGDSDLDIVAGGGYALFIYENDGDADGWVRRGNFDSTDSMGANGSVITDVDSDGDLDVISARYYSDIGWWENPCTAVCRLSSLSTWAFHKIGDVGNNGAYGPHYYMHDIALGSLDNSGVLQIVVPAISSTCGNIEINWFEPDSDVTQPWKAYVIEAGRSASSDGDCNHAGVDLGDVNGDGRTDVAFSNGWYEAPADVRSSWPGSAWHPFTNYEQISNTVLRDMNGDGRLDAITSSGHFDGDHEIRWFSNPGGKGTGLWPHAVVGILRSPECLQVADMDSDQDLDIITCDLNFSRWPEQTQNIYIFVNSGDSKNWTRKNVAPKSYASHLLQLVDINQDGAMDIVSEATGYSVVTYLENSSTLSPVPPAEREHAIKFD